MHKSILTFGLLASSLVMLMIMPFLNQNNSFSNVMAQEYDKYRDSSYSQYPTDDKKYECRTGPFEGFFVSSVEFCKQVKFDDKDNDRKDVRDNRTGTQGPQGPQDPPGEVGQEGEQGDPGLNQILPANLYYNPGNEVLITSGPGGGLGTPGSSTATCLTGDIAIGGNLDVISYNIADPLQNSVVILYNGNEGFDKYRTVVQLSGSADQMTFTTNVLCFNNP